VDGDFSRGLATFNPRAATVIFKDRNKPSTISGSTQFYNFTCLTPGKVFYFQAGSTQIIMGTLSLRGADLIMLRSTEEGEYWYISPQGPRDITDVDVKDSYNRCLPLINPPHSQDSGNNVNWFDQAIEPGQGETILEVPELLLAFQARSSFIDSFPIKAKKKYRKDYQRGKYRTTVRVFKGEEATIYPYDEKGPKYEEGIILFAGQQLVIETGAPLYKYGFDYQVLKEIRQK
jgi:hypothetical protein